LKDRYECASLLAPCAGGSLLPREMAKLLEAKQASPN
jgi:hypothetical protein